MTNIDPRRRRGDCYACGAPRTTNNFVCIDAAMLKDLRHEIDKERLLAEFAENVRRLLYNTYGFDVDHMEAREL